MYLLNELGKSHGSCVEGELQLCSAAHHAILGGLVGFQGLYQESVADWPLHQEASLHSGVLLCTLHSVY